MQNNFTNPYKFIVNLYAVSIMQTPHFHLSIFDFIGTNDTHQIDPPTPLERGRETNLQYLPTNTSEARYQ